MNFIGMGQAKQTLETESKFKLNFCLWALSSVEHAKKRACDMLPCMLIDVQEPGAQTKFSKAQSNKNANGAL